MRKRIVTAVIALMLLVSGFAMPANAATANKGTALRQKITQTYKRLRASNGYNSYHGYCGKMAAYTLYHLGIDKRVDVHNGKDEYDAYKNLKVTTGGYKVTAYPAAKYSLEEALNAISEGGTRDVYNMLVGFQRTNTEAGQKFGHAVVIYGILDGKVYFTESFATALGGQEGSPVVCTIKEFADSYNRWTTFEGVIYFGTKSYADFCTYYPADLYVQTTESVPVYNIPSDTDVSGYAAKQIATILPYERIEVSGLYENGQCQRFYEISYNGRIGYIEANKTYLVRVNTHKLSASGFNAPSALQVGKSYAVSGSVSLKQDGMTGLTLAILDQDGKELYGHEINKDGTMASITKAASNAMLFSKLAEGVYTYKVTCDIENYYVSGEDLLPEVTAVTLVEKIFTVGNAKLPPQEENVPSEELINGWQFDEKSGKWKHYFEGALSSGWVLDNNADYYILADGTVATGCVEINGENRYFTSSGVMCTDWYETAQGRMYLLSNGAPAKGWHKVDGTPFYFDENGILDSDEAYVPEDHPELELPTDVLFTELFENLDKFSEVYEQVFQ